MEITSTDYKSQDIQGKQRSHKGSYTNPLDGVPSEVFDEELITYDPIAERVIHNEVGSCALSLTEPAKLLPILNPTDDSIIPIEMFIGKLQAQGGFSHEDYFMVRYSMYRQTANERDAVLIAARVEG